jgi:hypothetical protein
MPVLKSGRFWPDIPRVAMFDDVDLNENEDMSNPNERPRSMLVSCLAPWFRGAYRLTLLLLCNHTSNAKCITQTCPRFLSFRVCTCTVQLWDKKAKRDDDLSDSEDEGEGGRRFEKDRSMKASSKKPSGEVSMDISKAPSPTAESTADAVVTTLDGAGLGLSLDTPGTSKVGAVGAIGGDAAAPSLGGVEAADTVPRTVGNAGVGGSGYENVMGNAAERDVDVDMVG